MSFEVGQKLNLKLKSRTLNAEIVGVELLNPGDRNLYSKRDSNPIYKVTARVPEMNLVMTQQIEMTDRNFEDINKSLEEMFSNALAHGEGKV